jgi:hypothetical protein
MKKNQKQIRNLEKKIKNKFEYEQIFEQQI